MTDLEITRLCAEAMEINDSGEIEESAIWCHARKQDHGFWYDPLHDDAQAMALVKKFHLRMQVTNEEGWWWITTPDLTAIAESTDLNHAICECVAKMQASKDEADKRFGQPHYEHPK